MGDLPSSTKNFSNKNNFGYISPMCPEDPVDWCAPSYNMAQP